MKRWFKKRRLRSNHQARKVLQGLAVVGGLLLLWAGTTVSDPLARWIIWGVGGATIVVDTWFYLYT